MLLDSENLAVVRTELDDVFFQVFEYDATDPGVATATTGAIFKQIPNWHLAQYIYEVNKGVTLWSPTSEVGIVPADVPATRNKVFVSVVDYTKAIPVSKDFFDDNQHEVWARDVADMALKGRVSQDFYAFNTINGGFTTTLTADGQPLFSTAHNLIGGGTISNSLTGQLSFANLNTMMQVLRTQEDQAGVILGTVGVSLLVPPALFWQAVQETQSALQPDGANNNVNVLRSGYNVTVYQSPYLSAAAGGSDTAYFMLGRNHAITRIVRQGIETALTPWWFSPNRVYNYQGNYREVVFAPDYVATVGSTGLTS